MLPLLLGGAVFGAIAWFAAEQKHKAQTLGAQQGVQTAQTVGTSQAQANAQPVSPEPQPGPTDDQIVIDEPPDDTSGGSATGISPIAGGHAIATAPPPSPGGPGTAPGAAIDGAASGVGSALAAAPGDLVDFINGNSDGMTQQDTAANYQQWAGPTGIVF
jgi:hypothetical protein